MKARTRSAPIFDAKFSVHCWSGTPAHQPGTAKPQPPLAPKMRVCFCIDWSIDCPERNRRAVNTSVCFSPSLSTTIVWDALLRPRLLPLRLFKIAIIVFLHNIVTVASSLWERELDVHWPLFDEKFSIAGPVHQRGTAKSTAFSRRMRVCFCIDWLPWANSSHRQHVGWLSVLLPLPWP